MKNKLSARTIIKKIVKTNPDYTVDVHAFEKPTLIVNPLKKEHKDDKDNEKDNKKK